MYSSVFLIMLLLFSMSHKMLSFKRFLLRRGRHEFMYSLMCVHDMHVTYTFCTPVQLTFMLVVNIAAVY